MEGGGVVFLSTCIPLISIKLFGGWKETYSLEKQETIAFLQSISCFSLVLVVRPFVSSFFSLVVIFWVLSFDNQRHNLATIL